jgi:hypothetical protein
MTHATTTRVLVTVPHASHGDLQSQESHQCGRLATTSGEVGAAQVTSKTCNQLRSTAHLNVTSGINSLLQQVSPLEAAAFQLPDSIIASGTNERSRDGEGPIQIVARGSFHVLQPSREALAKRYACFWRRTCK